MARRQGCRQGAERPNLAEVLERHGLDADGSGSAGCDLYAAAADVWEQKALYPGWNQPPIGPDYAKNAVPLYMRQRANTIEGGSEEIQKNVISKQVLGL